MTDQKKSTTTKLEDTLACTAFAEEGEPCPVNGKKEAGAVEGASPKKHDEGSALQAVENDFACTAFHDQNEKCPIDRTQKK